MPSDDIDWDDLRLILAVARAGGIGAAADPLGINASTVFRRLGAVEARVGQKLFERRRGGYVPTVAGTEIITLSERMENDVQALARRFAGRSPNLDGIVRITTSDTLLVYLLTPILARLRRAQPGILLDVVVTNQALNLSRRDADIAIRAGSDTPPDTLVGRRIGAIGWALYRSAEAEPVDPGLADWVSLAGDRALTAASRIRDRAGGHGTPAYTVDTVMGLAEAIEAGLGVGALPCFIGDGRPGLVCARAPQAQDSASLWLLTHADLRDSPRIRAVLDHLAGELTSLRPRLAGCPGDRSAPVEAGENEQDAQDRAQPHDRAHA